jgi:hypothetical protein
MIAGLTFLTFTLAPGNYAAMMTCVCVMGAGMFYYYFLPEFDIFFHGNYAAVNFSEFLKCFF